MTLTPSPHGPTADDWSTAMPPPTSAAAAAAAAPAQAPRPAGETGDSPQRRAQRMHADARSFDLPREVDALRQELSWRRGDRNAKTLVQERGLRVVLVALKPRARLAEHESRAHLTVHVLAGRLLVRLSDRTVEAAADRLLSIEAGVAHELEALEECAFVLTIAGTRPGPTTGARRPPRAPGAPGAARAASEARSGQTWDDDGGRG
jgi:quercetin dioxygenase-like cupin family protein